MPVITIRGQLGSNAPQIGRLCAEAFHLEYYDREIISRISDRLSRPREEVIAKEMLPVSLGKRIARAIEHDFLRMGFSSRTGPGKDNPFLDDKHYLKGLKSVIRGLARTDSVVINGRGSQFFLKDFTDALHVLTVAPLELRLKRVMESFELDEEAAVEKIKNHDTSHHEYIKKYFHEELEDPEHYDITVNTAYMTNEAAVETISRALSYKRR